MSALRNIQGERFGRLTVIRRAGSDRFLAARWLCRCTCGNERIITASSLIRPNGPTRSCGCLRNLVIPRVLIRHGLSGSPTYRVWSAVITRCFNPRCAEFKYYGGSGVAPCAAIRASAVGIVTAIGERPAGLSIDRIRNSDGYWCGVCPECLSLGRECNIRWATRKQQSRNQTTNRFLTIGSITRCIAEWAEVTGIKSVTIRNRLARGLSPEAAIKPVSA